MTKAEAEAPGWGRAKVGSIHNHFAVPQPAGCPDNRPAPASYAGAWADIARNCIRLNGITLASRKLTLNPISIIALFVDQC
jgi:hypothetical protein